MHLFEVIYFAKSDILTDSSCRKKFHQVRDDFYMLTFARPVTSMSYLK